MDDPEPPGLWARRAPSADVVESTCQSRSLASENRHAASTLRKRRGMGPPHDYATVTVTDASASTNAALVVEITGR